MFPPSGNGDVLEPRDHLPYDVTNVTLSRPNNRELGFNVVGGKDSEHLPGVPSPFVAAVRPHGEAYRQGIKEGDRIIKIDDVDVSDLTHVEVVDLLRSGENIKLTIEPNGEERIITESMSTRSYVLPSFTQNAYDRITPHNSTNNNDSEQNILDRLMDEKNIVDISPSTPKSKDDTPKSRAKLDKEFERNVPESVYKRHTNAIIFGAGLTAGVIAILTYVHGRQFFSTFKGRVAAYFIKSAVMPEKTVM